MASIETGRTSTGITRERPSACWCMALSNSRYGRSRTARSRNSRAAAAAAAAGRTFAARRRSRSPARDLEGSPGPIRSRSSPSGRAARGDPGARSTEPSRGASSCRRRKCGRSKAIPAPTTATTMPAPIAPNSRFATSPYCRNGLMHPIPRKPRQAAPRVRIALRARAALGYPFCLAADPARPRLSGSASILSRAMLCLRASECSRSSGRCEEGS